MWLSFGGAKSENEFVAPELVKAKLHVKVGGNFGKSKIPWKVEDPGRFQALNRPRVLAGANFIALQRAHVSLHVTRRAVLPKSNTVTGVIGPVHGKNSFYAIGVFKHDVFEICKLVWSRRIFPIVFSHVAFVWRYQIAK